MAKKNQKKGSSASNARQAKIQAAQKSSGGGANKIVIATVVAVLAIVATVGGVIWADQSQKNEISGGGNALPPGVGALGEGFPAYQDATVAEGAPTVDIFVDFQCPACASFESALGATVSQEAQAGNIALVVHVKNFLDDNLGNDSSTRAGNAAFCAADAGAFEAYHDTLFANQPTEGLGFTDEQLTGFAESVGIAGDDLDTWQACVDANKYVDYVNSVEDASARDGVNGTPTVRINGEEFQFLTTTTEADLLAAFEAARS